MANDKKTRKTIQKRTKQRKPKRQRRQKVSRFAPPIIQTPSRRQFIPPETVGF